jgi:D-proline reductase (dithiol) PrdB
LIASEVEARGIPTICMSSARSITAAVNPPRAVFLDFPLGHTAGKANDKPLQRKIMIDTLSALDSIQAPGTIIDLPYRWAADDGWKDSVMRPDASGSHNDDRTGRDETPQFQLPADEAAAARALETGRCAGCFFPGSPDGIGNYRNPGRATG